MQQKKLARYVRTASHAVMSDDEPVHREIMGWAEHSAPVCARNVRVVLGGDVHAQYRRQSWASHLVQRLSITSNQRPTDTCLRKPASQFIEAFSIDRFRIKSQQQMIQRVSCDRLQCWIRTRLMPLERLQMLFANAVNLPCLR